MFRMGNNDTAVEPGQTANILSDSSLEDETGAKPGKKFKSVQKHFAEDDYSDKSQSLLST